MMSRFSLILGLFAIGCGVQTSDTIPPAKKAAPVAVASPEGQALMLPSEPAGAKGVAAVRKEAKDGDDVVVVGRVGGSSTPFTEGRASFLIVDPSLKPTAECECPWDYCEVPKKELAAGRLLVKFEDAAGKALPTGGRELFGIQELSTVVVQGKVRRDDKDNVVVLATRLYVRPDSK
jgi:hypothetical protein